MEVKRGERAVALLSGYAVAGLLALVALLAGDWEGLAAAVALAGFHTSVSACLLDVRWCRWAAYAGFAAALLALLAMGIKLR